MKIRKENLTMWIDEIRLDFSLRFIDYKLFVNVFLGQEGDHEG